MFTEPGLFDLEMELIFENNWIYACHEREIADNRDFVTMRAGLQPLIITRDGTGQLKALINAFQHRGGTLTRVGKGNQSTLSCPFHAWRYKSDGRLMKVKAPGEYPEGFDKATRCPGEGFEAPTACHRGKVAGCQVRFAVLRVLQPQRFKMCCKQSERLGGQQVAKVHFQIEAA